MASGFGVGGSVGRCYAVWMDFSKCMADGDSPQSCAPLREDYLECLHHRKEYDRMNVVNRERIRSANEATARAKANFEHKWFGKAIPAEFAEHGHGH